MCYTQNRLPHLLRNGCPQILCCCLHCFYQWPRRNNLQEQAVFHFYRRSASVCRLVSRKRLQNCKNAADCHLQHSQEEWTLWHRIVSVLQHSARTQSSFCGGGHLHLTKARLSRDAQRHLNYTSFLPLWKARFLGGLSFCTLFSEWYSNYNVSTLSPADKNTNIGRSALLHLHFCRIVEGLFCFLAELPVFFSPIHFLRIVKCQRNLSEKPKGG